MRGIDWVLLALLLAIIIGSIGWYMLRLRSAVRAGLQLTRMAEAERAARESERKKTDKESWSTFTGNFGD
jgi:hypothetical protein